MNTRRFLPFVAVLAALAAGCQSTSAPAFDPKDGRVTVAFTAPEKFTDARTLRYSDDTKPVTDMVTDYVQTEVRRWLKAGETFSITFTDIDLAGEFEPERGPRFGDVRIIKPIYAPRFTFAYVLKGPTGAVLAQGDEKLNDLSFQSFSSFNTQRDSFFYEKEQLKSWIERTLKPKM